MPVAAILRALPGELQRLDENEARGRAGAHLFTGINSCVRVHTLSVNDRQDQA
jgi:hypothetical protein